MRAFLIALPLALTLAACSQEPAEGESADDFADRIGGGAASGPAPQLTPAPIPTVGPAGERFASGQWFVTEDPTRARAAFGATQDAAQFALSCPQGGGPIAVERNGAAGDYRIATGSTAATVALSGDGGTALGAMPASAPILAALAVDGGAATVTGPDGAVLSIPTSAAIRRLITACS